MSVFSYFHQQTDVLIYSIAFLPSMNIILLMVMAFIHIWFTIQL